MLSDNVAVVLGEFYRWSRVGDPADVGYPHVVPTERLRGGSVSSVGLSDEEALWVDRALALLASEAPEQYRVVCRVYRDRKTVRALAKAGEGSRDTLGRDLAAGMQFVRGVLVGAGVVV